MGAIVAWMASRVCRSHGRTGTAGVRRSGEKGMTQAPDLWWRPGKEESAELRRLWSELDERGLASAGEMRGGRNPTGIRSRCCIASDGSDPPRSSPSLGHWLLRFCSASSHSSPCGHSDAGLLDRNLRCGVLSVQCRESHSAAAFTRSVTPHPPFPCNHTRHLSADGRVACWWRL